MKQISFEQLDITGGFWKQKQDLIKNVTMKAVYDRFKETGRFDGFKCDWQEGMPNKPHIFWDSDVAKWIEAAAYILEKGHNDFLRNICEETIDLFIKNQDENGYFNQYFNIIDCDKRFKVRDWHELYCLGHFIEAAIAYAKATNEDRFLKAVCRYVDYVKKVFIEEKSAAFLTPGHEEIELALVKLYDYTGDKKYLDMSRYFVETRGTPENPLHGWEQKYNQSHLPAREQFTAEGHSVRAVYFYSAMADLALRLGDEGLRNACEKLFENITERRMYITGAIGSMPRGEQFSIDYDLPNLTAYAETCANLGLALFSRRMTLIEPDSRYADTVERVIYNGFLSGISLDGKAFFYENPLEIAPKLRLREGERYPITQRLEVFGCSCCPPNIVRFISSIGDFIYAAKGNTVYVNQYMESKAAFALENGSCEIEQKTGYPFDGKVTIKYKGAPATLAVRIPGWCTGYVAANPVVKGYEMYEVKDGDVIELEFDMPFVAFEANPHIRDNAGRYAIMRGPIVFCMEGVDNGDCIKDIRLDLATARLTVDKSVLDGVPCVKVTGYKRDLSRFERKLYVPKGSSLIPFEAIMIPYYAFANRGETDMLIWTMLK